jgi:hypothetical protein
MALEKLRKYCRDRQDKDKVVVVVGYSQNYALEVHERTDVQHRVGQAKYLETAARATQPEVVKLLREGVKTKKMAEAMLKAGLLIQRESQKLVPVDTSALKASAFTTVQEQLDQAAAEAHAKGEATRLATLAKRAKEKR